MVSGSHFLPARPLLCRKSIPAAFVTSVNLGRLRLQQSGSAEEESKASLQRYAFVFVNLLALVVVFGIDHPARRRDGLGRFVGFEAAEEFLFARSVVASPRPR